MELSKTAKITTAALIGAAGVAAGVLIAGGHSSTPSPVVIQKDAAVATVSHTAAVKPKAKVQVVKPASAGAASSVVVKKAAPKVAVVAPQQEVIPVTEPSTEQTTVAPVETSEPPATTEAPVPVVAPKVTDPATQGPGGRPLPTAAPPEPVHPSFQPDPLATPSTSAS